MTKELFSLGNIYPSDFLKDGEMPSCGKIEMKLLMDGNGIVMLEKSAPKEVMWGGKYWYRSSINHTMRSQLKNVVDSVLEVYKFNEGTWVDIASNDGYLLSCVPSSFTKIGIDPANDSFRIECERYADLVIQDYFSADIFKESKFGDKKASVITVISMFYDISNPEKFLNDVYEILDDNGVLILQLSYTPLMILQMAFDNVCHEHLRYYSLFNLKVILEKSGFVLLDCQLNDTNAGSFRVFAMKDKGDISLFGNNSYRDVCKYRIESLLKYEEHIKISDPEMWINFYENIQNIKKEIVDFIKCAKSEGKTIMGYGASTKGNTALQVFGLDHTLIEAIADRSPYKYGLHTIGTNIPIISEDEMRAANPDYLLILPFHFLSEFIEREKEYLDNGGKMIVYSPKFQIIEK